MDDKLKPVKRKPRKKDDDKPLDQQITVYGGVVTYPDNPKGKPHGKPVWTWGT